ncbi:uncharacterized protein LOC114673187 isoform X1 [Macaca mulatta]
MFPRRGAQSAGPVGWTSPGRRAWRREQVPRLPCRAGGGRLVAVYLRGAEGVSRSSLFGRGEDPALGFKAKLASPFTDYKSHCYRSHKPPRACTQTYRHLLDQRDRRLLQGDLDLLSEHMALRKWRNDAGAHMPRRSKLVSYVAQHHRSIYKGSFSAAVLLHGPVSPRRHERKGWERPHGGGRALLSCLGVGLNVVPELVAAFTR